MNSTEILKEKNNIFLVNKHITNIFKTIILAKEKGLEQTYNDFYKKPTNKNEDKQFIHFCNTIDYDKINIFCEKILEYTKEGNYMLTENGINTYNVWLPSLMQKYKNAMHYLRTYKFTKKEKIEEILRIINNEIKYNIYYDYN